MAGLTLSRLPIAGKIGVGAVLCALLGVAYYVLLHTDVAARIDREILTRSTRQGLYGPSHITQEH